MLKLMIGVKGTGKTKALINLVNAAVEKSQGDVVCIVEAMKLMNEIESEFSGKVVEVCVEDGQPVEFGQVLMYVE